MVLFLTNIIPLLNRYLVVIETTRSRDDSFGLQKRDITIQYKNAKTHLARNREERRLPKKVLRVVHRAVLERRHLGRLPQSHEKQSRIRPIVPVREHSRNVKQPFLNSTARKEESADAQGDQRVPSGGEPARRSRCMMWGVSRDFRGSS